jgi:hypothetical protein
MGSPGIQSILKLTAWNTPFQRSAERIAQLLGIRSKTRMVSPSHARARLQPSRLRLNELRAGNRRRLTWVKPGPIRYLSDIGLVRQAHLVVLDYSPYDGNLRIQIQAQSEAITLDRVMKRFML